MTFIILQHNTRITSYSSRSRCGNVACFRCLFSKQEIGQFTIEASKQVETCASFVALVPHTFTAYLVEIMVEINVEKSAFRARINQLDAT